MNLTFSDEHEQLRTSMRTFLRDNALEAKPAEFESGTTSAAKLWSAMAHQIGLLGLSLPERVDGLDLDAVSTMIAMEELGRALAPVPFLETVVICGALLARAGGANADALLARIVTGDSIVCFAAAEPQTRIDWAAIEMRAHRTTDGWRLDGKKVVVVGASWASHIIVAARTSGRPGERSRVSLFVVETSRAGIAIEAYPTVDGRWAADVSFNDVRLPDDALLSEDAIESLDRITDDAVAAIGAEAIGVLGRMLEETIEFSKQRRQFGQPLARFQVLQHRMVDMYMALELARSAVLGAFLKLSEPAQERALAASAAKLMVNEACRIVGQGAIQIHGGMGMTDELAISHLFKRATVIETEWGSSDAHVMRYSQTAAAARREQ